MPLWPLQPLARGRWVEAIDPDVPGIAVKKGKCVAVVGCLFAETSAPRTIKERAPGRADRRRDVTKKPVQRVVTSGYFVGPSGWPDARSGACGRTPGLGGAGGLVPCVRRMLWPQYAKLLVQRGWIHEASAQSACRCRANADVRTRR